MTDPATLSTLQAAAAREAAALTRTQATGRLTLLLMCAGWPRDEAGLVAVNALVDRVMSA